MKKTLNKTLSIILTIFMIATTISFAFAAGDGVPMTITIDENSPDIYLHERAGYYDEDGYIITGSNEELSIEIVSDSDITFKNITVRGVDCFDNVHDVNIKLEGENKTLSTFNVYCTDVVIDAQDDAASLTATEFTTQGNPGTVTVNGGNIVLVTDEGFPTINCADFIINGGTVTASNNYWYVVDGPVKLNGGTLNVISTSENREAINGEIIMNKGALLTVSSQSSILYHNDNILKADGLSDGYSFFVRYDKESEFVPVTGIKSALKDKTYAEIKIDKHEHTYNNGTCVCVNDNDHLCHSNNLFLSIIWRIVNSINSLLGISPYCECGMAHY